MGETRSDLKPAARPQETLPALSGFLVQMSEQETFNLSSSGFPGQKSGGKHGGIITEEHIVFVKKRWKIRKMGMLDLVGLAIYHKEPRLVAPSGRCLGHQVIGKIIVEKVSFKGHG
jgi:hypothetical protein